MPAISYSLVVSLGLKEDSARVGETASLSSIMHSGGFFPLKIESYSDRKRFMPPKVEAFQNRTRLWFTAGPMTVGYQELENAHYIHVKLAYIHRRVP